MALACGMVPLADGSDYGGSLRNPPNFCRVVGLRPSPGRVPNTPADLAWQPFSVVGGVARNAKDLAYFLSVLAGPDERIPISLEQPGSQFTQSLGGRSFKGVRVAMFHDMGLTPQHSSADERFEVDGANVARDFLRGHGIAQQDIDTVWTAIALHTTPGIPQHMHPVVALVTAGVEMDVLGINYPEFSAAEREAVVDAHPRTPHFKEDIIQAFYDGIKHKPETTFGNVKADVLADKDASFRRGNFCSVIRASAWRG